MTRSKQTTRWLRDAADALDAAREAVAAGRARQGCMNAQLAVEMAAKAIIARFAEPQWTHQPSPQLRSLLEIEDRELDEFLGPDARDGNPDQPAQGHHGAPGRAGLRLASYARRARRAHG